RRQWRGDQEGRKQRSRSHHWPPAFEYIQTPGDDTPHLCRGSTACRSDAHISNRNSRKKSVGSTNTSRACRKPASRPSSHHTAAVSGKSQVVTCCQICFHSSAVSTLHNGSF